jgi:CheY-like chemotaxis protein
MNNSPPDNSSGHIDFCRRTLPAARPDGPPRVSATRPTWRAATSRPTRPNWPPRRLREESQTIASFGPAQLVRHPGGYWELRGGAPHDHALAREWCSLFEHEATFESAPLPTPEERVGSSKPLPNRILIAEDDPAVRGSLTAVLESEGYLVDEARNGIEAVTRAIDHPPDLVLLDLNMPHWDGWTAFSRLDQVSPLLPVIVITARPNEYQRAVRLGVDAFMEKPLDIPALLDAIKRLSNEDKGQHVDRITTPACVTEFLDRRGA